MPPSPSTYARSASTSGLAVKEGQIEYGFIGKLQGLKYEYRPDIRDRAALERNFREKFEALNRVHLSDGEFARLLEDIVTPDVFTAARTLRERNAFTRDDGTPLNYTLVNIRDWCKNTFEVVNQLRINTDHSHHRYDWAAAGSVDTDLSFLSLLELYGTEIAERRMPARRVVEALDVIEHV